MSSLDLIHSGLASNVYRRRQCHGSSRHLQTGDLIFFVSTRKNLDTFHAGIIVRDGKKVLMRHASRSQGSVVEQELSEFLKANRMAGVIVVRPQPVSRRVAASS